MIQELQDAVEWLYEAFAPYQLRREIDYCDHCVSPDEAQVLLDVPLRQLSGTQLERFAWKTMSTWGDEHDFKHFLPRILELLATSEIDGWYLLGKTLGACAIYGEKWPPHEQNAVARFRDALWQDYIATHPSVLAPMQVLEALAEFDQPVTRYLNEWAENRTPAALRHLSDFVPDFRVSTWSDCLLCRELDAWLASGVPAAMLREAAETADDEYGLLLLDHADWIDIYSGWMSEEATGA